MIVVRVELWPGGYRNRMKHLGTMTIVNDGTGSKTIGNYDVSLSGRNHDDPIALHLHGKGRVYRGRVVGHPRLRMSMWRLIHKAVNSVFGEERGTQNRRDRERDEVRAASQG